MWTLPSPWSVKSCWSQVNHVSICQWAAVVSLSVLKSCTLAPAWDLGVPSNLVSCDSMIKHHRAEMWSLTASNPTGFPINPSCRKGQDTAIQMASPHTACSQQQCSGLLDTPRCSTAGLTHSAFPASCSPGKIWPRRSSPSHAYL